MEHISAAALSVVYRAVEVGPPDAEGLYELYRSNEYYHSYFSLDGSIDELIRDMTMLPDGCTADQKRFIAYYDGDSPVALLDLIEGYPDERTCYIGLFMVREGLHGRGIGSRLVGELCTALADCGYGKVRLAYGRDYAKAVSFWNKNGFVPVKEAVHEVYGELIVAERELIPIPN